MVQAVSPSLTLAAFLELPDTKPASEYIDGQIVQKPMPQGKHSRIQGKLTAAINAVVEPQKTASAFTELRCTFGDRSIVPDISVFTWDRIPIDDRGEIANAFYVAPDWTVEILSPDQSQTKVIRNILHCLQHGTQFGWLIDPAERVVFAYQPPQAIAIFEARDRVLPVPAFANGLDLTVGQLFDWLAFESG